MSDRATVKTQPLVYGTAGTATAVPTATGTDTSNPYPLPRDDYTIQVTVAATGTSIIGGQCVWQVSNDNIAWLPQGTVIATATNAGAPPTSTSAGASLSVTAKYAYGRGIVAGTGTGVVTAFIAS